MFCPFIRIIHFLSIKIKLSNCSFVVVQCKFCHLGNHAYNTIWNEWELSLPFVEWKWDHCESRGGKEEPAFSEDTVGKLRICKVIPVRKPSCVSQSALWTFWQNNSLFCGAVQYIVECLAAFLTFTYWRPVAPLQLWQRKTAKYLLGAKFPPVLNH